MSDGAENLDEEIAAAKGRIRLLRQGAVDAAKYAASGGIRDTDPSETMADDSELDQEDTVKAG